MSVAIDNQDPQAAVRLHNGAVFVARRVKDVPKFKIAALLNVGASHDTIPGIAHFFEHLPFGKTRHFADDQISRFFLGHGGYVNAFTGYDHTVYHGEVLKENYRSGICGIAEMVCSPVFEAARVAQEAETIITEWAAAAMNQGRNRFNEALKTVIGKTDFHTVIGTPASIASITATDVESFYNRHYTTDNFITYMQGDLDQDQMLDEAVGLFTLPRGERNQPGRAEAFCAATSLRELPHAVATHAAIIFPGRPVNASLRIKAAADLCSEMLTFSQGGLLREVRQSKRLVYGIEASGVESLRWAFAGIGFDAFPGKVADIGAIIMRHTAAMASQPDAALFGDIRQNSIVSQESYLKKNDENNPASEVAKIQATNTISARDAYFKAICDLTIEDIADYAKTYFAEGPLAVCYEGKIEPDFPDHVKLAGMRVPVGQPS